MADPEPVLDLRALWRARAGDLERYAPAAAEAFRQAATELEEHVHAAGAEELTLDQAASESGYSKRRLRELVAAGTVPNSGRKGAPRIRRSDLPRKPRSSGPEGGYDVAADADGLLDRMGVS